MTTSVLTALEPDLFVSEHLVPGRPVLVRGALADQSWPPPWELSALVERFGDRPVPTTDALFTITRFSTLRRYLARHTGGDTAGPPPYIRWFVRQNEGRQPWSDDVFDELAGEWSAPHWLPDRDYVFPPTSGRTNPARDPFPAKGLFICSRGGQTRLHVDPWASDACLCQMTGTKRLVLFPPDAAGLRSPDGSVADLGVADADADGRCAGVLPAFDEVLEPGDALFIPAGWYHTALALTDSVSITWNFVHRARQEPFVRYLRSGGDDDPTVRHFLGDTGHAEGAVER